MDNRTEEAPLTPEGLEALHAELQYLTEVSRAEVAGRLKQALDDAGDLAENSEFLEAQAEYERLERRIALLEERLRTARVIEPSEIAEDVVEVGTVVRLRDLEERRSHEYMIVGPAEADPADGRLSIHSPVGQAIAGKRKGVTVDVETPSGRRGYRILAVRAA